MKLGRNLSGSKQISCLQGLERLWFSTMWQDPCPEEICFLSSSKCFSLGNTVSHIARKQGPYDRMRGRRLWASKKPLGIISVMQKLIERWIWLNYPSLYNSKTDNQLNDNKIIPLWLKSLSKEPGTRFITDDMKQKNRWCHNCAPTSLPTSQSIWVCVFPSYHSPVIYIKENSIAVKPQP